MIVRSTIIFFIAIVLYLPSLSFEFVYDDHLAIIRNEAVTSELPLIESVKQIFSSEYRPGILYRPITTLTYRLNYLAGGLNPFGFHLVNILIHGFCGVLVFLLLIPFCKKSGIPFLTGLIFVVHPLHTEAVCNVIGRAELLTLFFGALSVLTFTAACKSQKSFLLLFISALTYLAASLSKETGYIILGLAPLYALLILDEGKFRTNALNISKLLLISLIPVAIISLGLRYFALDDQFIRHHQSGIYSAANPLASLGIAERIIPAFAVLGRYIYLLIIPNPLRADYSQAYEEFFEQTYSVFGLALAFLFLIFCFSLWLFRKNTWSFWGLWFLIGFSITSNVFVKIGTIMGERLAYLPSVGFIAFILLSINHYTSKQNRYGTIFSTFVVLIAAVYSLQTYNRIPVWKDNTTFFKHTVIDSPLSPKANFNYALHLYVTEREPQIAEKYFRKAFELMPNNLDSAKYILQILVERNDLGRAKYWAKKVLALDKDDPMGKEVIEKLRRLEKQQHS